MSFVEGIRADPAAFVRGWPRPEGLVYELVALSTIELLNDPSRGAIEVELVGPLRFVIEDPGRGMNMAPEPGHTVSHAEYVLTHDYPIATPREDVMEALTAWVWGARGSRGPVIVSALSASLVLESHRDGVCARQEFAAGAPVGPAVEGPTDRAGTRHDCTLDPALFPAGVTLERERIEAAVRELTERVGEIEVRVSGARGGEGAFR